MTEFLTMVATTVDFLPERFDLPGLVLSLSGLGALLGAFGALLAGEGRDGRAKHAETGALIAALVAIAIFLVVYVGQKG
jgi:hypothetical protein